MSEEENKEFLFSQLGDRSNKLQDQWQVSRHSRLAFASYDPRAAAEADAKMKNIGDDVVSLRTSEPERPRS
jgi:hypothetical protein